MFTPRKTVSSTGLSARVLNIGTAAPPRIQLIGEGAKITLMAMCYRCVTADPVYRRRSLGLGEVKKKSKSKSDFYSCGSLRCRANNTITPERILFKSNRLHTSYIFIRLSFKTNNLSDTKTDKQT